MLLIDSHCHLDSLGYNSLHQDVDDVLAKAAACDVKFFLAVATSLTGFSHMCNFIGDRENVVFSCGVHPLHQEDYTDEQLYTLAQQPEVVAIGETGLDYHYSRQTKDWQQESFRQHIRIARQLDKPVIVHTREARQDTLTILKEEWASDCGGVLHCFTEDQQTAAELLDLGFFISFSGVITFASAEQIRQAAKYVPLDRLLVETDSPYLAPVPHRGKENHPAFVREIAQYIASLKQIPLEVLAQATSENFLRLFPLSVKKRQTIAQLQHEIADTERQRNNIPPSCNSKK